MPFPSPPGQIHEDASIVMGVLRGLAIGETISYADVAKAIQYDPASAAFARRCATARRQLRIRESIVIACVPQGGSFIRESELETHERCTQREIKSIGRKARKHGQELACVRPSNLPEESRPDYFSNCVILKMMQKVTSKAGREKLAIASATASAEITVRRALEVLRGENGKPEDPQPTRTDTAQTDACRDDMMPDESSRNDSIRHEANRAEPMRAETSQTESIQS